MSDESFLHSKSVILSSGKMLCGKDGKRNGDTVRIHAEICQNLNDYGTLKLLKRQSFFFSMGIEETGRGNTATRARFSNSC